MTYLYMRQTKNTRASVKAKPNPVAIPKARKAVAIKKAQLLFTNFVHQETAPNPLQHQGFVVWAGALTNNPPAQLKFYESNTDSTFNDPRPLTPPGTLIYGYMMIKFPFPAEYVVLSLLFDGQQDARIDFYDEQGYAFENTTLAAGPLEYPVTAALRPSKKAAIIGIAHKVETAVCKLSLLEKAP